MHDTRSKTLVFVWSTVGASLASAMLLGVLAESASLEQFTGAALFGVFGVLAHALAHRTTPARAGTIGFLPFLAAACISPNASSVIVVAASVAIAEQFLRRSWLKRIFNVAQFALAQTAAIAVYRALGGVSFLESHGGASFVQSFGSPVAFAAMFVAFMVANKTMVGAVIAISSSQPLLGSVLKSLRATLVYDVMALPLVFLFAVAYVKLGAWGSTALAIPMIGLRQLYKSNDELEQINEELLQLMVAAIEARDPYTSGHSQRVARYSRVIARLIGLSSKKVEQIGTAALLHDVGKIHEEFAPLLRKPSRLSDAEYDVMKTHSAKGAVLVAKVSNFRDLVPSIRGHHEAWSGRGYPDALSGDDIPLGARIITIADTIDAMTTVRPYRPPRTLSEVRVELERVSGTQFDPRICTKVLAELNWRELCLEVEIAAREFPAEYVGSEFTSDEIPRHSLQFRTP
jgi:putative nucleotidyltransferase with HDIG domain